jgi:hypothetical protein
MVNKPMSWNTMPTIIVGRNKPASKARPENAERKNMKKACTLPIHDIVEGDCGKMVVLLKVSVEVVSC